MTRTLPALRVLALLAVVAAIIDPGCVSVRRPSIGLLFTAQVPAAARDDIRRRLEAGTRAWADVRSVQVVDPGRTTMAPTEDDVLVVAGDPSPVLSALREAPAALAVEVADPVLAVTAFHAPSRVALGTRVSVHLWVAGIPRGTGTLTVRLVERAPRREVAHVTVDTGGVTDGTTRVAVPWLPLREGPHRLRAMVTYGGSAPVRDAPPADLPIDVLPARVRVEAIEARPTWSVRFARLALQALPHVDLVADVRVAPGVSVRTSGAGAGPGRSRSDADVLLVGGVDALTDEDVAGLERDARERGRAVVLLLDEPAPGGPWRRLWPDPLGAAGTSAVPTVARVGGHVWKAREWLSPALSTEVAPLAYLDSERQPVVTGRSVGAGRIVLVTALDAWRWRAEDGVAFAAGWQSLVQALAADVPPPLALTAWASGHGRERAVHADVTLRPDVQADGGVDVTAEVADGRARHQLPLFPAGPGRWRGALRPWDGTPPEVEVRARRHGEVVGSVRAVVDVSPVAPTASWADVTHHQHQRRALASSEATMPEALRALRAAGVPPRTDRWFVTRTWWYPGLVVMLLGSEWILRRALRRR